MNRNPRITSIFNYYKLCTIKNGSKLSYLAAVRDKELLKRHRLVGKVEDNVIGGGLPPPKRPSKVNRVTVF